MFEINNLRVLNDYLNQTIDVLVRAQRIAGVIPGVGLSHSAYGVPSFLGAIPGVAGIGLDPTVSGITHSPFLAGTTAFGTTPFATSPFAATQYATSPFAAANLGATSFAPTYAGVVDPFVAQRGLNHTPAFTNALLNQTAAWSPLAELARQQQIAATATAFARQQMLDAMVRGNFGI